MNHDAHREGSRGASVVVVVEGDVDEEVEALFDFADALRVARTEVAAGFELVHAASATTTTANHETRAHFSMPVMSTRFPRA